MKWKLLAFFTLLFILPCLGQAAPYYGATISTVITPKDPPNLRGFQFMLDYDPQRFQWRKFNIYFDGGFSRFTVDTPHNNAINIYSIAPVIRYSFKKRGPVVPYFELSIGLAWLSRTHLADKNYGIHFSFQDRLGMGAFVGDSQQLSLGIHAVHYSNAHLAHRNSGITIPLVLDVGYRFQ